MIISISDHECIPSFCLYVLGVWIESIYIVQKE